MPKLLLIDTDPSFIYLVARYCQLCGCTVVNAHSGDEAMALAATGDEEGSISLVIIHLTPPARGGFALVQSLKRDAATAHIPILLCGSSTDAAGAWEAGVDHWLSKPVMFEDFRAVLLAAGLAVQGAYDV